jgi:RHS repeat-associated protein
MKKIRIMEMPAFTTNTFAAGTGFGDGRINKTNNSYDINYFITDHLGSTRAIVNANGSILEQKDYYPFGKEHENANLMSSTNRWNFSGKEKQTIRDLGWLDFSARMYANCEIPIFTTQDPLAEKYYSISPYAYCANNPVNRIDPNGMEWLNKRDEEIARQLQQQIASRDKSLAKQEQKINAGIEKIEKNSKLSTDEKNKQIAKQQEKLDNVQEQRTVLSNLNDGITQLGNSQTAYTFNTVKDGTTAMLSSMSDGAIVINNYGTVGNRAHETTHAIQHDNGEITFNELGTNKALIKSPMVSEIQAYRTEYSITNGLVPSSDEKYPRTIFGITLKWLYGVKKPDGSYPYTLQNYK